MSIPSIAKDVAILASAGKDLAKLKDATQKVEGLFIKDLLAIMKKGGPKTSFGEGFGTEIFDDMMNQAVADAVSSSGSFGFGKALFNSFAKEAVRRAVGAEASSRIDLKQ